MKLGFWTLYDVDWTNEEIAQRAAALGTGVSTCGSRLRAITGRSATI